MDRFWVIWKTGGDRLHIRYVEAENWGYAKHRVFREEYSREFDPNWKIVLDDDEMNELVVRVQNTRMTGEVSSYRWEERSCLPFEGEPDKKGEDA